MTRKPLSPEAKAEAIARLNDVMRKFCEDVERRNNEAYGVGPCIIVDLPPARAENERMRLANLARHHADELARAMVRLADELGANV